MDGTDTHTSTHPQTKQLGALLANFLLSFFSQPGHDNGEAYADWVLEQASKQAHTIRAEERLADI